MKKCAGCLSNKLKWMRFGDLLELLQERADRAGVYGDVWTFIGEDVDTKLIPSYLVGKRDMYHAQSFMADLAGRVINRISTDVLVAYPEAVERAFGTEADYGQVVKTYSVCNLNKEAASRYSPADVVRVGKRN